LKKILLTITLPLLLTACATITSPSSERVNVNSTKNKTFTATIDGQQFTVPGSVKIKRNGDEKIILTTEKGCAPSTSIDREIETIFWGNFIFGGVLGSSTDLATGKMWDYDDFVTINCVGNG
jgi:hypothetical protein